jgi:hypothetical protein
VRRSFSKRSEETAIFTLPLLRLKSPPVETRTAGSEPLAPELHCELLVSSEPELLPSEPDALPAPLIEPAPEEPLDDPRLEEPDVPAEPVDDPVLPIELAPDEPELLPNEPDVPVEPELEPLLRPVLVLEYSGELLAEGEPTPRLVPLALEPVPALEVPDVPDAPRLDPDEPEPDVPEALESVLPLVEPVALAEPLSPVLPASEPLLEPDVDCIAVASWRVAEVSITMSSIEPSFWPLRS